MRRKMHDQFLVDEKDQFLEKYVENWRLTDTFLDFVDPPTAKEVADAAAAAG